MAPLNINLITEHAYEVLDSYFILTREAELHREQEEKAAIRIQAAWRRKATLNLLKKWTYHTIVIQRCYRGHLGQEFTKDLRRKEDKLLRLAYFGKQAKVIQRHFRGYWSRKYKYDYYKRTRWIKDVVCAGKKLMQKIYEDYNQQWVREQEEADKNVNSVIDDFIQSSHYRVGTDVCKGTFYSPLIAIFGRGRSYLEEHVRDARRKQVTGMQLWKLKGYDEYGIPIKVANNKFFIKQSKIPHSKLSMDTRRRVEEAALISTILGTYITHVDAGLYITKRDLILRAQKEKDLHNPHAKDFSVHGLHDHTDYNHLEYPTIRQQSEWGARERLRKEEQLRLEAQFPQMVEEPFTLRLPSGKLFDIHNNLFAKVFPKRHHHTHFPQGIKDRDHRLNSEIDRKPCHLQSMSIARRGSLRASHVT